ncbi:uncharacterized protein STEHIDRAFT_119677 [Stereum hirsutum FP-91666 SS1]|uniref:uncharacterized protein n=1 Tax=Stereum hirsutum (strain FP-91666) TaxID=721885 RepID=UPI000440F0DF|nr:uncharacterized protein STEHIDRAFT_119677 [Stereum hirsutum FP-91666 SS1]EIM88896.1 hypothetical protein STEHIDRAFT_119677 [Stereum hirsutum FP-91666 SS1]
MSTLTGTESILQATRYPFGGFGTSTIAATSVLGSPGRSPPTGPTLVPFIFTPPGSRRNSRAVTDPVTRTGRRSLLSGVTPSQHAESEPVRPSRSEF